MSWSSSWKSQRAKVARSRHPANNVPIGDVQRSSLDQLNSTRSPETFLRHLKKAIERLHIQFFRIVRPNGKTAVLHIDDGGCVRTPFTLR